MRAWIAMFKVRFIHSMQYRAAAWAGCATQIFWGCMEILLYLAFYREDPQGFTMQFSQLTSYLWLRQAFFSLFLLWSVDNEILEMIMNGNVAYEITRPVNLYGLWFARNLGTRLSRAAMRCVPIFVISFLLPAPYGLSLPASIPAFLGFILSMMLGIGLIIGMCMWIYILTFYFITARGIQNMIGTITEFLSGALIPIPFMPEPVQKVLYKLPFASSQSTPFLIYSGYLQGQEALLAILLQLFWMLIIIGGGIFAMKKALLRVTVQGG